jgi:hypothetical protein
MAWTRLATITPDDLAWLLARTREALSARHASDMAGRLVITPEQCQVDECQRYRRLMHDYDCFLLDAHAVEDRPGPRVMRLGDET